MVSTLKFMRVIDSLNTFRRFRIWRCSFLRWVSCKRQSPRNQSLATSWDRAHPILQSWCTSSWRINEWDIADKSNGWMTSAINKSEQSDLCYVIAFSRLSHVEPRTSPSQRKASNWSTIEKLCSWFERVESYSSSSKLNWNR